MKRIFTAILVVLFTASAVTGCGTNTLADYKKAVDKTNQIVKGQSSGDFSVTMDFNTEGMTPEEINQLNYYRHITGSFKEAFDSSKGQGIYRNYMNLGGLGFDVDIYKNGEEMFVKLPVIGKYMKMDEMIKGIEEDQETQKNFLSDDTLAELGEVWVGMLKEEDIFKGKDIVLTTPDGEVKTTVYTITLNGDQITTFAGEAITLLSEDETLRSNMEAMWKEYKDVSEAAAFDFDQLISKIKEQLERENIKSFQYTAYVDIDGYIVNEIIEVVITKEAMKAGEPKSIDFYLEIKNWDINKEQTLEFPELTEENTLKTDDLDQIPSLFKNMFWSKQ